GRITPGGTIALFTEPGIGFPTAITSGPDGNLWITDANDSIHVMTIAGDLVATHVGPAIADPGDIVSGPDGNLWYANGHVSHCCQWATIGRISTAGDSVELDAPSDPEWITS